MAGRWRKIKWPVICLAVAGAAYKIFSNYRMSRQRLHSQQEDKAGGLSAEEIAERLRKNERRQSVVVPSRVSHYTSNSLPSNVPTEDRHSSHVIHDDSVLLFGVYDGHSGWQVSEQLSKRLGPRVDLELKKERSIDNDFSELLKRVFVSLDNDIGLKCLKLAEKGLDSEVAETAAAGSCAVVATIQGDELIIANTGDCRAVLAVRQPDGKSYKAIELTLDQDANNPDEVNRLLSEHPGEEHTVWQRNRLFGQLQPLRSFGDFRYKWTLQQQEKSLHKWYGRQATPHNYVTPPYLTAEPVITRHRLSPNDAFLVLATDGLWEKLNSDRVVCLVGEHIHEMSRRRDIGNGDDVRFDSNPSTHLIRHALGGKDDVKLSVMLTTEPPFVRWLRDDITVVVIFFKQTEIRSKL
ncbi:pyruvate dehydrogenase [acetyl-transferring]-phosphatase 2, mitochondrial-like [Corticium candelabrum]|uniref:pyruvate dehydrogenase [acetyl-transferring]-phosphatase 2, mitochondrial-like n=1 Tax=Corticium candelabrum TaxID=121492 RepID=UPI002E2584EA|nr:pyruvate dehydrogenase [acetyl-transferring]-phosphatase 2, mitochondrial-like [Corticium candelabrum]